MAWKKGAKRNFPLLVCPFCGSSKYKTLAAKSTTRCCGKVVARVNGAIYCTYEDSPEWELIAAFVVEKRRHGLGMYDIPYKSGHYQQILPAVSGLLKKCRNDLELALAVIDISFNHKDHCWRNHPSFFSIVSKTFLPDVLAKAYAIRIKEKEAELLQETRKASLFAEPAWALEYAGQRGI